MERAKKAVRIASGGRPSVTRHGGDNSKGYVVQSRQDSHDQQSVAELPIRECADGAIDSEHRAVVYPPDHIVVVGVVVDAFRRDAIERARVGQQGEQHDTTKQQNGDGTSTAAPFALVACGGERPKTIDDVLELESAHCARGYEPLYAVRSNPTIPSQSAEPREA